MVKLILVLSVFTVIQSTTIFDFSKESNLSAWNIVNDDVMGGRSESSFGLDKEGNGEFRGSVSLANNGGFSSVRHRVGKTEISSYSAFILRIKGDGKEYQFRAKTSSADYYSYITYIGTNGEWQEVEIAFDSLYPNFRGRRLNMDNYPGEYLDEIGFLIGNNKEEDFSLLIDWIKIK